MTEPLIAAAESVAGPLVQQAVKQLAPEAAMLLNDLRTHVLDEAEKLKAQIDAHHLGIVTWLEEQFTHGTIPIRVAVGSVSNADPTSAVPAPQS